MRAALATIVTFLLTAIGAVIFPATADAAEASSPPACTTALVSAPAGHLCGLEVTVADEGGRAEIDAYEGIRYARAQRWKEPAPVPPTPLFSATEFGPLCPQPPGDGRPRSEDCLFLNLWTPTRSSVENLPVMVFIHGGFFVRGAGSLPIYDGARLAARGDVVVVTFNYRLGALGFLAGGSGADRLAGDYGFEDQQLALAWVKRNIRSFGGDPAKVTIFGQGAGAMATGAHLVAPGSRALFRNAIMESNPYGILLKTPKEAADIREKFDQIKVVKACRGRLSCLEKLPAATIVAAQGAVQPAEPVLAGLIGDILAWAPAVDGRLIAVQPNRAAISRPVIAGTNRDEGALFVAEALPPTGLPKLYYDEIVAKLFKSNTLAILAKPRYRPNDKGNLVPLANLVGDYFFSCATRHVLAAAKGNRFGYLFDHPPSYKVWPPAPKACQPGAGPDAGRVCDALELPFVFRNPVTLSVPIKTGRFTPAEQKLVDAISAYWTGFADENDPNSGAAPVPEWASFGRTRARQVLDLRISRTSDDELNCKMWDAIGYNLGLAAQF